MKLQAVDFERLVLDGSHDVARVSHGLKTLG